jgi:hypothetical protein
MRSSDSITKISAALAKALPEIQNATKDAKNPAYRSTYATLNAVMDAVKPALFSHGVVVVQGPGWRDGIVTVTTRFLHESGEWIETEAGAPVAHRFEKVDGVVTDKGPDAQTAGSAISYLRRYSLAAMAGITQEDDDGNAASGTRPEAREHRATSSSHDDASCPKCGGPMWDNRATKTGKQPDYKCKDKGCDTAIWLDSLCTDLRKGAEGAALEQIIDDAEAQRIMAAVESRDLSRILKAQEWLDSRVASHNAGAT